MIKGIADRLASWEKEEPHKECPPLGVRDFSTLPGYPICHPEKEENVKKRWEHYTETYLHKLKQTWKEGNPFLTDEEQARLQPVEGKFYIFLDPH